MTSVLTQRYYIPTGEERRTSFDQMRNGWVATENGLQNLQQLQKAIGTVVLDHILVMEGNCYLCILWSGLWH